jgi:hypothetical protein
MIDSGAIKIAVTDTSTFPVKVDDPRAIVDTGCVEGVYWVTST